MLLRRRKYGQDSVRSALTMDALENMREPTSH